MKLKKYFLIINIGIQHLLVYRARSAVWFLLDIFTMFIMPFVWLAAYGDSTVIEGINKSQIVTYFFGVVVIQTAVASHLEQRMRQEIKSGEFSNLLVKPVSNYTYMFLREFGWRISYSLHLIPVLATAMFFFRDYLYLPESTNMILLTCVALTGAAVLFSLLNYLIGLLALFVVEAEAVAEFFWLALAIFSGTVAPLRFFPEWFEQLAAFLPFKYLIDFPLSLYLGTLTVSDAAGGLAILLGWIIATAAACRLVFQKGLKAFEGVGL